MKILVFVDTHDNQSALKKVLKKAKDVDIIICLGDISVFGKNLEKLLLKFKQFNTPFIFIHGNHEYIGDVKKIAKKNKFLIFLHQSAYKLNNYIFFGYGGGGMSQKDLKFENITKKFKKTIKKENKVILLTHAPPYGTKLDHLPEVNYVGNKSFTRFIKGIKPIYHFCGHLHENQGKIDRIGNTKILNPGPEGKIVIV